MTAVSVPFQIRCSVTDQRQQRMEKGTDTTRLDGLVGSQPGPL